MAPPRKNRVLLPVVTGLAVVAAAILAFVMVGDFTSSPVSVQKPAIVSDQAPVSRIAVGEWPCYPAAEVFRELERWMLVGDKNQINRTLRNSHSIPLKAGSAVNVIDADVGRKKVRVLESGVECWVATEAVQRP